MKPEVVWPALAVVTHESESDLRRALPGLVATAERLETAVIVVDNASPDGTIDLLRAWSERSPALRVEEWSLNRGYATAANHAFALAGERDVFLLNPDVELPGPEPVRALAAALSELPQAGIVAPRLIDSDGTIQPSARRLASVPAMLGSLGAARAVPPLRSAYTRYLGPSLREGTAAVGWVIGAAMLVRRRAFEAVGGFDEDFFLYMEDADFCCRLNASGWEVDYVSEVKLRHGYARASSQPGASVIASQARRRHIASLARYWRKHPRAIVGGER